jgi:DNA-binding NarL/FixJ family response regulator
MSDTTAILLLDSSNQDRKFYAQHLRASSPHYEVIEAATGRTGLDLCARQPIECVILEIDLSDMSGFEVLAQLVPRPSHPEIAIVVLTGIPNFFLLELALKNGAQAALHKTMTRGDTLDIAIVKAISAVQREKAHQRSYS